MENSRWLHILVEKKKLDSGYEVSPAHEVHPFYFIEGVNAETSADESLLIYDCSTFLEKDSFEYNNFLDVSAKFNDPCPVVVFKNWEHERTIYWKYLDSLSTGPEKKSFTAWYDKKLSVYIDCCQKIIMETDDRGINYLEYSADKGEDNSLHGRVYNVSFFELKKLFNVTGAHLFIKNVRYGLRRNSTGDLLRTTFRKYIGIAVFQKAVELKLSGDILDSLNELLGVDAVQGTGEQDDTAGTIMFKETDLLPKNFWFYHNGISIFSDEHELETPVNTIILTPDKVSVINGAQTLTNFYLEAESIERSLEELFAGTDVTAKSVIDAVLKVIFVKTIIIYGNDKLVRPITHGLNTQIPILEESLLADSELSDKINNLLATKLNGQGQIRILKDGELWTGSYGLNVVDFVKNWLTISGRPGQSKNLGKKRLKEILTEILEELKVDTGKILKMSLLSQINQWWDAARNQRINAQLGNEEALNIGKYGKNYFGSYVLHMINASSNDICLDDPFCSILYERFIKDLKAASVLSGHPIVLGAFKSDVLYNKLLESTQVSRADAADSTNVFPDTIEDDLKERLNRPEQNAYSFAKTITDYLLENGVEIDYFRVISRSNGKCREAFAFPNATFNEIVEAFRTDDRPAGETQPCVVEFENSAFAKAVERTFPVFVIDKDDEDSKNAASKIFLIEDFTFAGFIADAKTVYQQTVQAFEHGDENEFPKSGEKKRFHVRPKAMRADDSFQFTNGSYITKRTFWANRDTVESAIINGLEKKKQ